MRWLSSFALLVYLSLLCTSQALAVHDSRLSPLADSELQALNPALTAVVIQKSFSPAPDNDNHDDEPVGLASASRSNCPGVTLSPAPVAKCLTVTAINSAHPARAPPVHISH